MTQPQAIIVCRRHGDYHACVAGDATRWESGASPERAVFELMKTLGLKGNTEVWFNPPYCTQGQRVFWGEGQSKNNA